jgi:hypothetical protein
MLKWILERMVWNGVIGLAQDRDQWRGVGTR